MTDRERITTLLRQGLSADAIAAILNTDLAHVRDVQVAGGSLPAGGGSGLVVGAWEELSAGDFPAVGDPPILALGALDAPSEVEFTYIAQPNTFGGFSITNPDDSAIYATRFATYTDATPTEVLRSIVPAGENVEIHMLGSVADAVIQLVRRRPLG